MGKTALAFACLGLLLTATDPATALETAPFRIANRNPFVMIYGLPPAAGGDLLPPGGSEAALVVEAANHFTEDDADGESIFLDGETYRVVLDLRHALASGMEIGAEIPWISHHGGFLDSFIEGFHDTFGLPQGGREEAPRDRLLFAYTDGEESVLLEEGSDGLGDIRLTAAWPLLTRGEGRRAAALRAGLKLPTGDSDRLLGSGSTDLALQLAGTQTIPSAWGPFTLFVGGGVLLLTEGDVLPDRQRNLAGLGTLGGAWRPGDRLTLKVQLDGHSALYDSALIQLGESVQITFGGTFDWERWSLDVGLGEDLLVDSAPDIVFHLALRTRF